MGVNKQLGGVTDFIRLAETQTGNQATDIEFTNTFGGETIFIMRGDGAAGLGAAGAHGQPALRSFCGWPPRGAVHERRAGCRADGLRGLAPQPARLSGGGSARAEGARLLGMSRS